MKKLLIVEDEATLQNVMANRFREDGWEVTTANNGQEALETLSKAKFDLMLLDVMMPVMDGFEVLKKIKNTEAKDMPVVVLTNFGSEDDIKEAMKLGAKGYFIKAQHPLDELISEVNKYI